MKYSKCALSLIAAAFAADAVSQGYPAKPVLVVSSSAPGSSGDAALRMMAAKMGEALGQPVVVEVRTGAGGSIAAAAVSRAAPDGHTILYGNTGSFVFPRFLMKNVSFDITKDFSPISQAITAPTYLTVHKSVPTQSLKDLVEYSKRNPGKLSYASTGVGSIFHLIGEGLKIGTGMDMLHVPYAQRNFPQLMTDFAAGRIQVYFPSYGSLKPYLGGGDLKVLAIFDRARSRLLPDVPQINELLPSFGNVLTWWGYFGPSALQRPIAERLATEVRKSLEDPVVSSKLLDLGISTVGSAPDELALALKTDLENTEKLVKALGIQPQ